MIGTKETACSTCMHRKVCKLSENFLKAQTAVDGLMVHLGDKGSIYLRDMNYISAVNLQCKHHVKEFQGGAIR